MNREMFKRNESDSVRFRRRVTALQILFGALLLAQCTPVSSRIEVPAPERQTVALGPAIAITTEGCRITVDDAEIEARVPTRNADRRLDRVESEVRPVILVEGDATVSVTATAARALRFARSGTFVDFLRGDYREATAPVVLADTIPDRTPADEPLDCALLPRLTFVATDYLMARDAAAAAGLLAGINPPPDVLLVDVVLTLRFDGQPVTVDYTRVVRVNVTSTGELLFAIGNGDGVLHDALGTAPSIRRP